MPPRQSSEPKQFRRLLRGASLRSMFGLIEDQRCSHGDSGWLYGVVEVAGGSA
jgi:hypothetical protein